MAETTPTRSTASLPAQVDAPDRGKLTIHDRVVERLAAHAALDVPGVSAHRDLLDKAVRRRLPRASAQVSGQIAAVDLEVGVAWGSSLDHVTSNVRRSVRETLQTLVGLDVKRVNVTVKRIIREQTQEPRVR